MVIFISVVVDFIEYFVVFYRYQRGDEGEES